MALWFSGAVPNLGSGSHIGGRCPQYSSTIPNIDNACMVLPSASLRACSSPRGSYRNKGGVPCAHRDNVWQCMSQTMECNNGPQWISSKERSRETFSSPNRRRAFNTQHYNDPILPLGKSNVASPRVGESADGSQRKHYHTLAPSCTVLYPDHNRDEKGLFDGYHKSHIEHPHQAAIEHPSRSLRHYTTERELFTGVKKKIEYAPYATSMDAEQPPRYSKRFYSKPSSIRTSDDVAVGLRSTQIGRKAQQCSKEEAFTVALSANPERSWMPHNGDAHVKNTIHKVGSDFQQRIVKQRTERDNMIMNERINKSLRAYNEEAYRLAHRETKEHDISIKNKSHTPRVNVFETPWAINLPAPHMDTVGRTTGKSPWRR